MNDIEKVKEEIKNADAILVGAGAGLSTSAGFTYSGERFEKNFKDFIEKYNFPDMYSGGFYDFNTLEEKWAYWSRYIKINRYEKIESDVYSNLLKLIQNKNYFVLTTNVDHCFQKTQLDKTKLFYTQGDYGLFQCSVPCHNKTYDNEMIVEKMVQLQKNMKIPTYLIPKCPVCGKPMSMNLRTNNTFVEDEGWKNACTNYENFLSKYKDDNILFLELGVGENTPAVIKYPFWKMTAENPNAKYVCINKEEQYVPEEIKASSICIANDIGVTLRNLCS
ncbi:MAG: Sir2 silent information regulator family NAD-dependent deacetylase [Treponema sp.]